MSWFTKWFPIYSIDTYNSKWESEYKRAAQEARLGCRTYLRHVDGRPHESPDSLSDAARLVIEHDAKYGVAEEQTECAHRILRMAGK